MPQVDLETLVSVCGGGSNDRKIACADDDHSHPPEGPDLQETPPDFPPESFWLSKDAEFDWFDRNAFLERKESTKGNFNNHSTTTTTSTTNLNPNSNSSSQRFSMNLKSKASILGLPKTQKSCFTDMKLRRNMRPANIQLFPKRSQPANKSSTAFSEPASPKVSCMGRVRSKRDRSCRRRNRLPSSAPATVKPKPERHRKTGLWTSFRGIFRTGCRHKPRVEMNEPPTESTPRKRVTTKARVEIDDPPRRSVTAKAGDGSSIEPVGEAPGLGEMNRFASGRRSSSWSVDEMVTVDVTKS